MLAIDQGRQYGSPSNPSIRISYALHAWTWSLAVKLTMFSQTEGKTLHTCTTRDPFTAFYVKFCVFLCPRVLISSQLPFLQFSGLLLPSSAYACTATCESLTSSFPPHIKFHQALCVAIWGAIFSLCLIKNLKIYDSTWIKCIAVCQATRIAIMSFWTIHVFKAWGL